MFLKILIAAITLVIGLGGGYESFSNWATIDARQRAIIILSLLLLLFIFFDKIKELIKKHRDKKLDATTGELKSLSTDKIRIGIIGATQYNFTPIDKSFQLNDPDTKSDFIKASIVDDKLKLNFLIYGIDKKLVAGIQDNFWTVYERSYEYNNDNKAFEIVTPVEKKVLFQICIENDGVKVAGLLKSITGAGLYLFSENSIGKIQPANSIDGFALPNDKIEKLFKYPRRKFLGKRSTEG